MGTARLSDLGIYVLVLPSGSSLILPNKPSTGRALDLLRHHQSFRPIKTPRYLDFRQLHEEPCLGRTKIEHVGQRFFGTGNLYTARFIQFIAEKEIGSHVVDRKRTEWRLITSSTGERYAIGHGG